MIKIRRGVFETNSSSTHSITMCSKKEYEDWVAGKTYYTGESWDSNLPEFATPEQVDAFMCRKDSDWKGFEDSDAASLLQEYGMYSYSKYIDYFCECYESFEDSYTTASGDKVVAFGYYGHD